MGKKGEKVLPAGDVAWGAKREMAELRASVCMFHVSVYLSLVVII